MRTVSFVDHLELEYSGNISSKSIAVGDVDNDKSNELVVGTIDGELFVYKGTDTRPWAHATDLGMITCLAIGDVCNHGSNLVVTLSSEGWCNVFAMPQTRRHHASGDSIDDGRLLRPIHRQHLAANNKTLLIADIDGDGLCELVIGYSDRRVRSYRWKEIGDSLGSSTAALHGKFIMLENWQLAGQVGSVTVNQCSDGSVDLMVSQPGGTFVTLMHANATVKQENEHGEVEQVTMTVPSLVYHPLGSARARNPGVSTELIGNISSNKKKCEKEGKSEGDKDGESKEKGEEKEEEVSHYSAVCTLDGTLTLLDVDKILWSVYVDHQLFSLNKLDVTGDGLEEVVACSWDGQTYLANLHREVVRFQFRENVAAFCAGQYAVEAGVNVPCLIYATFNGRLLIYYNISIHMPRIANSHLLQTMAQSDGISDLLQCLNCNATKPSEVKDLYHWVLYGYQQQQNKNS